MRNEEMPFEVILFKFLLEKILACIYIAGTNINH